MAHHISTHIKASANRSNRYALFLQLIDKLIKLSGQFSAGLSLLANLAIVFPGLSACTVRDQCPTREGGSADGVQRAVDTYPELSALVWRSPLEGPLEKLLIE